MSGPTVDHTEVSRSVRQILATMSNLDITSSLVAENEPLNGSLLCIDSLALLGMLLRLEDELGVTLADDLFVGRSFTTVADIVDVVCGAIGMDS